MPPLKPNKTGRAYWRSLDELADTPRFRAFLEKEFADYCPEQVVAAPSRRTFMKIMGASMALAGVGAMSGCRRWPQEKIAPYNERPAGRMPGVPVYYATIMELGGVAHPLLIKSFDGRPLKAEGNGRHPMSQGAAGRYAQASLLQMYDPERSRSLLNKGKAATWDQFLAAVGPFTDGAGLTILSEATSSPSIAALRKKLSKAAWYEYESISRDAEREGTKLAFGQPMRPMLDLTDANIIACFDADILGTHPAWISHAKSWSKGRTIETHPKGDIQRMYACESSFSITGTNADHRLAVQSGQVLEVLKELAQHFDLPLNAAAALPGSAAKWVKQLADDLAANKGKSLVAVGPNQPAAAHAVAAMINEKLGNVGKTVAYAEDPAGDRPSHVEAITKLTAAMKAGSVGTLVILGGNPVFDAPIDLGFADALKKVKTSVHLSQYVDETSNACTWHLPQSHYLEAWSDARSWDGTLSVGQPMILPLYDSRSSLQLLALLAGEKDSDGEAIVRATFSQWLPATDFERQWRKGLCDGLFENTAFKPASVKTSTGNLAMISATVAATGLEVNFREDHSLYDGRFANNGWLQELPDSLTKLVWDNAAIMSPATAAKYGLRPDDLVELAVGDLTMLAPVFMLPGHADESITLPLGYGRTSAGYVGNKVGFDVYQIRSAARPNFAQVRLKKTGRRYRLVTTQDHYPIDPTGHHESAYRANALLVREATTEQYAEYYKEHKDDKIHEDFELIELPEVPSIDNGNGKPVPLQLYDETLKFTGHRWAMSIDLSKCIGCSACVIACQAENNIAIVGKYECGRGRHMHWIRVDRYFKGDPDQPSKVNPDDVRAVHQPLTCHQCENAPCEEVCPVAATTHDTEGLNVMVYNRCIGTRYCSNNCPYKVRRFNWFDWNAKPVHSGPSGATWIGIPDQQQLSINKIRQMGFNPDVTVRMRGVMEKCSFCVQRIKAVTIPAKNADPNYKLDDGAITPACAQTCPTDAIVFGDLSDPDSRVSKHFQNPRAYEVLKDLNVRARTRYLARINNPAGEASPASEHDHA